MGLFFMSVMFSSERRSYLWGNQDIAILSETVIHIDLLCGIYNRSFILWSYDSSEASHWLACQYGCVVRTLKTESASIQSKRIDLAW